MKNLKKKILIVVTVLFALSFINPNLKAESFEKGNIDLNFQIGFGTAWYYSTAFKMGLPFISVGADYALRDDWGPGVFGVGAIIGVNTLKYDYYLDDYKNTNFSIVPRATYHYQFVDKLDTYAGLATGVTIRSYSGDYIYTPDNNVEFVITVFAGVKYFFTDNFAVMSELYVYDLALFNIGVCLKL